MSGMVRARNFQGDRVLRIVARFATEDDEVRQDVLYSFSRPDPGNFYFQR